MSEAWNVALICVSRSTRSTTMSTVGLPSAGCSRSFCAANTMSSDLPEPWKCQMRPFCGRPAITRCTIRLAASYCWYRQTILMRRFFLSVANSVKLREDVQQHRRPAAGRVTAASTSRERSGRRRALPAPRPPEVDRHADRAVHELLALGGDREDVGDEQLGDEPLVVVMDLQGAVDPAHRRAHRRLRLDDDERASR